MWWMQTSEYNASEKKVIWNIKKFPGTTEQGLRIKVRETLVSWMACRSHS
jgi:hypothetical protein